MPELPEVEAARRAVQDLCCGKRIVRAVVADDSKVVDGVSPAEFEKSLVGRTIIAAHRKGKNMWLELDSPPFPSFQFGMSGAIYIKGVPVTKYKRSAVNDADEWPSKYSKLFIELDDGLEFSFTDKRRFAKVRLLQDPASVPPISELGPDALLEPMSADEFADSLSKKKIAIKALLLDQAYIAGIGNWVADEVLYQARIHPLRTASSLSRQDCEQLHNSIKEVIEKALAVGADSNQFPSNWIFHFREKKPGKAYVDGKRIEFITVGGRTTAFVPELQKLTGASSETVKGRSRREAKSSSEENVKRSNKTERQAENEEASGSLAKRKKRTSAADDKEGQQKKGAQTGKGKQVVSKKAAKVVKTRKKVQKKSKKK
ncbi:formamidopyrimidine-DNA glycosylase isoform X2 [Nymphaea colorata]|uniref:formamidopyrimidine-DNA glycosylase isoform X2 n=1 Tax=Nymphaea colorata TaxID=210225 RepID=UPI00129D9C68|nr:formamidopyrimidine-DNA glycosylase isoform X2 [Nymphaea colorata]